MGTNFYWTDVDTRPVCPTCKRPEGGDAPEELHIGKSSAGWCFSLHVFTEGEGPTSLDEWRERFSRTGSTIRDEYGDTISAEEMIDRIVNRRRDSPLPPGFDYISNHAQPGPRNLLRHRIGPHCVGHGDGTWDLIPGTFS